MKKIAFMLLVASSGVSAYEMSEQTVKVEQVSSVDGLQEAQEQSAPVANTRALESNFAVAPVELAPASSSPLRISVMADGWINYARVNEVARGHRLSPMFGLKIEHQLPYVPNVEIRYSRSESAYSGFDKLESSFYFRAFENHLMSFDLGLSVADLSKTYYKNALTQQSTTFDGILFGGFGSGTFLIPQTNFALFGQAHFGESKDIRHSDLIAGLSYRLTFGQQDVSVRAGYRVIDLESKLFSEETLGKEFILAHGPFVGVSYCF